jgi:hypothetical protein
VPGFPRGSSAPAVPNEYTRLTGPVAGPILDCVQAMPAQGPSIQRHAPRAASPPGLPGLHIRRPTTHRMDRVRPDVADRPGKALTGHDVQELPRAANRCAPLSRRAGGRCASPAATPGRRRAPLLRHERLPDDPSPRPSHGRRGLPDLRLRAPARLTDAVPRWDALPGRPGRDHHRGRIVDNPAAAPESRGQNPLRALTRAGDHLASPKGP